MELNWKELEQPKSTPAEAIFGKKEKHPLELNDNQRRRLRKLAKEYLFDDVGMALSLVVNLGLKQLEEKK